MKGIIKLLIISVLFNFYTIASEGTWDSNHEILEKFSKTTDSCDFTTLPIISDSPRAMVGRAERAQQYLINHGMQARNVVSVLGDNHIFLSSLEPCSNGWIGGDILDFSDAFLSPSESSFLKEFLANYSATRTRDVNFLRNFSEINSKQKLIDCLKSANQAMEKEAIISKAVIDRINSLNNKSGYDFFKELIDIIDAGNLKDKQVPGLIIGKLWLVAKEILIGMESLAHDEPRAIRIISKYIAALIDHTEFLKPYLAGTKIIVKGKEKDLEKNLLKAKEVLQQILIYSYTKGAKVADIIKLLKESGETTQEFFHAESLLAAFINKHNILSHCGDDLLFYTQRDMCAVCEATWRKLAESIIKGKIYVLSSEPYIRDESWKRHDPESKLIKIPTRLTTKGDLRNLYIRNLLLNKSISGEAIALYTAVKNLFIDHEFKLLENLENSTFSPEKILNFSQELVSQSGISSPELSDIILKFTKEQMLNRIEILIANNLKNFLEQLTLNQISDYVKQVGVFIKSILSLKNSYELESLFKDFETSFSARLSTLKDGQNIILKFSEKLHSIHPIIKDLLEKRFFIFSTL